jgi:hypothetical protein
MCYGFPSLGLIYPKKAFFKFFKLLFSEISFVSTGDLLIKTPTGSKSLYVKRIDVNERDEKT